MIYKIEKGKTVFESNPGLDSNERFSKCTDRELRYIFWLYDIESPYIKMRFKDRQIKAALEAGYRKEGDGKRFDKNARAVLSGTIPKIENAIEEFLSIQRVSNINYSVLTTISNHIDRNLRYLEVVDETKLKVTEMVNLNKIAAGLEDLIQTKINIEAILNIDAAEEEDVQITGTLSMLDQVNVEEDL